MYIIDNRVNHPFEHRINIEMLVSVNMKTIRKFIWMIIIVQTSSRHIPGYPGVRVNWNGSHHDEPEYANGAIKVDKETPTQPL